MARGALAAVVFVATSACAPAVQAPPPETPEPANCRDVLTRARAEGARAAPPVADMVFVPPEPPRELRDKAVVVHLRIDEEGRVDPASVRVEGSTLEAYNRRLSESIAAYRFSPARLQGCRIAAETSLRFEL
jgi:hypothetical protein